MADEPAPYRRSRGSSPNGRLACDLRDVDAAVLERVKLHILDQIGAQVSCCELPAPRIAQAYVTPVRPPRPGLDPRHRACRPMPKTPPSPTRTAGSSFEIDDYGGNGAYAHPGCVVVPGGLAVAEALGATAPSLLRAAAAGFETIIRLALATMPSMLLERGFHQTACARRVRRRAGSRHAGGDDLETTVNALGVAGSHASGTTEYSQSGGEVKRAHAGIGAAGGIRSARLARLGLSGPATIFEGKRGFLQAFCNAHDARFLHEAAGLALALSRARRAQAPCLLRADPPPFRGLRQDPGASMRSRPTTSSEVVLGCEPLTVVHTGATGPRPTDIVGAQFSAEYGIAMRIVKGRNDVGSLPGRRGARASPNPAVAAVAASRAPGGRPGMRDADPQGEGHACTCATARCCPPRPMRWARRSTR